MHNISHIFLQKQPETYTFGASFTLSYTLSLTQNYLQIQDI